MSTHRERNLAKMTETVRAASAPGEFWAPVSGIVDLPDGSILLKTTTTSEAPDAEREIADFEPMRDAIRDFMAKSAELREMHKGGEKGGVPEVTFDDELRKIDATIHVTDPVAIQKVRDGHYTGVSWGGKKWVGPWVQTAMGKVRHIVKAVVDELSLADRPANPDALLAKTERDMLVIAKSAQSADEAAASLLSDGPPDVFIGDGPGTQLTPLFPGEIILNAPSSNLSKRKEPQMAEAAKVAPVAAEPTAPDKKALRKANKLAKTQIATAKLQKRAAKLAKKGKLNIDAAHGAIDAVGTAHAPAGVAGILGEAHAALDAKAKKPVAPDDDATADDGADDDSDGDALAKAQRKAQTKELRKSARAARKTIKMAKLAKTIRRAANKGKSLAKVGARNSRGDSGIIDSIHDSAVALGSQKCMAKAATGTALDPSVAANVGAANGLAPAVAPGATMAKADNGAVFDALMERINNEISAPLAKQLTSVKADILTDLGGRLAKVEKMPAGGGPLVAPARGGSDTDQTEAAILSKAADRYPKGSIEREALGKASATSEIAGMQQGR